MPAYCIRDLMTTRPQVCTPGDPLVEVARLMRDDNIGALPVVNSHEELRVLGIVTDRDIVCRVVAIGADPAETAVAAVMSVDVTVAADTGSVEEAMRLMGDRQVRRLPVVD